MNGNRVKKTDDVHGEKQLIIAMPEGVKNDQRVAHNFN